jgi:hypothetical protein
MRNALLVVIFLTACLTTSCCYAQSISRSQGVGGDFGRNWLSSFKAQNPSEAEQNLENGLWTWGGSPKGSIIVNGKLVPDPYYIWKSMNFTWGWLGRAYLDPYTGNPVYAYVDPFTGGILYFYVDPNTGRPAYVYPNGVPEYVGTYPIFPPNYWPGGIAPSQPYNSNGPWR